MLKADPMNTRYVCVALLGIVVARGAVTAGFGPLHPSERVVLPSAAGMGMQGGLSSQWFDRTPSGKQSRTPKGVEDCAMIYDPLQHRILLFGGKTDAGRLVDGLWAFDLAKSVWQEVTVLDPKPPAVEDHSALYDPIGQRMIIYGGIGGFSGSTTNNLWSFDLKTQRWRNMKGADVPRRELHSAVYDERGKRMVVFGGADRTHLDLYEVWALDLDPSSPTFEKWQNLTVEEGHPPGRLEHTAAYDPKKNRMVIHAGYAKAQKQLFQDTWEYVFDQARDKPGRWRRIDTGNTGPTARRKALSVYDASRGWLVIEGGEREKLAKKPVMMADAWAFDLTADVWLDITPNNQGPAPRIGHRGIYDSDSQSVVLYGGVTEDKFLVPHDVWELRIQAAK
jgi:galactose oxidase-like protein